MEKSSLNFVFINGRSSSGKDTQADLLIAQNSHAVRISTGDIYRGAKTQDGKYGRFHEQIKPYIEHVDSGGYIPDEVILPIVDQVIKDHIQDGKDTFIFTGFPRTVDQLYAVDKYIQSMEGKYEKVNVNYVCYAVLEQHSILRAEKRRRNAQRKGFTVREDDNSTVVLRRLQIYKEKTEPMLKLLLREKRLLIIKSNRTINDVRERTNRALGILTPDSETYRNPHKER